MGVPLFSKTSISTQTQGFIPGKSWEENQWRGVILHPEDYNGWGTWDFFTPGRGCHHLKQGPSFFQLRSRSSSGARFQPLTIPYRQSSPISPWGVLVFLRICLLGFKYRTSGGIVHRSKFSSVSTIPTGHAGILTTCQTAGAAGNSKSGGAEQVDGRMVPVVHGKLLGEMIQFDYYNMFFQMGCNHQLDSHLEPQSHGGLVQMIFHDFPFQLGDFWGSMFSFRGVIDLEGVYHIPKRTMKMWIQHLCSFERWGSFVFFLLFVFQGKVYCWKNCGVFFGGHVVM